MPKPKKQKTAPPAPIETSFELREELRRRGIAARVGIPAMPVGVEHDSRRAIAPTRKGLVE